MPVLQDLIFLFIFGFAAGFVDAVVGGGGLIQIPALMMLLPGVPIATLFGTNKFAGFSGTLMASYRYFKTTTLDFKLLMPAIWTALVFSFVGAWLVAYFDKAFLEPIVLILLALVLLYTLFKPYLQRYHKVVLPNRRIIASASVGMALGLYDGFFGPGTGSFLIMAFVALFGMNFLAASAHAKIINLVTNIAALIFFIAAGHINFYWTIPLAAANMAGAFVGAKTAVKRGEPFIRPFYIIVVTALLLKLSYQIF